MNQIDQNLAKGAAGIRAPVIINQLGPEIRKAIADHWSRPHIIDHPSGRPPWEIPADADVLLTRPFAGWESAPSARPAGWPLGLRWIQTASTGVDFFPSWLLDGTVVTTGRGISAVPIAEYVLAAIFAFEKRLHVIQVRRAEDWGPRPSRASLGALSGKTIGIVGFGSIGRAVAQRAIPLGLAVKVLRRSPWHEPEPGIVPVASIESLIESVDHLVLAVPATPNTVHLIDAGVLARARRSLHLINVARGKIVDQAALLRALDTGQLAGATLDVTEPEPPPEGDPIYSHPKIVLTPHISWTGGNNGKLLADKTAANLDAYARGAPLADIFDRTLGY